MSTDDRGSPQPFAKDSQTTKRWPIASAILLIGGDKTGGNRFYERMIPVADELYDVHLKNWSRKDC